MKTIVFNPRPRRSFRASSINTLMSLIELVVAENGTNRALVVPAIIRARVVFPDPGGPHRIIDGMRSLAIALRRNRPSPNKSSRPTISSIVFGRSRSASGASGGRVGGGAASSKREPVIGSLKTGDEDRVPHHLAAHEGKAFPVRRDIEAHGILL